MSHIVVTVFIVASVYVLNLTCVCWESCSTAQYCVVMTVSQLMNWKIVVFLKLRPSCPTLSHICCLIHQAKMDNSHTFVLLAEKLPCLSVRDRQNT